ncbi:ATP-binding protein [Amedibacillus sp. YH-ame6]
MYVDPIYIYGNGNIVSFNECITYYYQIKPINSLYASDSQLETLITLLQEKILSVNMPGVIFITPKRINEKGIIDYYEQLYKVHQKDDRLDILKQSYMNNVKRQLSEKIKYSYHIYLAFVDNRDPLKKKMLSGILKKNNDPLNKRMKDLTEIVDEQIFKKLNTNLTATRLTKDETQALHNYLAIPVEGNIHDYSTSPQATNIEYSYKYVNQPSFHSLYSRILIVEKFKQDRLADGHQANIAVNEIQLYGYPVDTIIKFDLEHTQVFKNNMRGKREDLRKSARRYTNLSDRRDKDAEKAMELAKIGEEVDPSIEDSKIRWQMMFRIRANSEEMLTKRSDNIQKKFEGKGIKLTYAIGEQEKLANNLFPFKNAFHHYLNLTDILYFSHFNFFGGLYIGEEDKGVILSYTVPADLPVRIDIEAPMKGLTKTSSTTSIFAGETGSGKSQLANSIVLLSMIFYGHKTLNIDPKGDRYKLVEMLNQFGDITSHLIIGDKSSMSGMFDAFLLNPDDQVHALSVAKNDIVSLVRAVNADQRVDLLKIDEAYEKMCIAKAKGNIKKLAMTHLVDYLMEIDPVTASNVKSLKNDPMARLFYGDDTTDISKAFNLDKPYNLVTFARMPVYSSNSNKERGYAYDDNNLEHKIFALVLSKVNDITNMFIRQNKGIAKTVTFDEAKLYATVPGGISILVNNNLIARSELCNMGIILQNWSDIPDSIINNTGQFFIGNMGSKAEIELILKHFDLENNSALYSTLQDRTKNEGVSENKKYNFLYCDYNNRKCITKMKILDIFQKAFRTFKNEDIEVVKSEITNGDDPYE